MRRLRGQDAAFWYGETPSWHMHIGTLMVLDPTGAPDFGFAQFKKLLIDRLHIAPIFRWRIVDMPFGLDRPVFVESVPDPEYHIRRIAVPAPGGRKEVEELVSHMMSYKLDRTRPLWEMWFVEGLEGGRVGLFGKVHHAIVDGVSGAGLLEALLDLEPTPREVSPEVVDPIEDEPMPSQVELLGRGIVNTALFTPYRIARMTRQFIGQAATLSGWARRDDRPPLYFDSPLTRLNGEFTAHRSLSGTRVDLNRVKAVKSAFGVKVNDVVLALGSGAIRDYLLALDELPDQSLTAQVPVSLRNDDDRMEVGNKVGTMSVSLATEIDDPAERLLAIHASSSSAKEMRQALSAHTIMGISEAAPPALIALAARGYTSSRLARRTSPTSCVISNVPGPDFPFYVAGARVESFLPIGPPVYGIGLNITAFSYLDHLQMGFMTVPELVPQVDTMADAVEPNLAALEAAMPKRSLEPRLTRHRVSRRRTSAVGRGIAAGTFPSRTAVVGPATPGSPRRSRRRAPSRTPDRPPVARGRPSPGPRAAPPGRAPL